MGHGYRLRPAGHHHQPLQTGEGPQGHCRRQAGPPERLSQVPALCRERGLRRPAEPSRPGESPHHPADHQRQRLELPVQPLRLLQRTLHRVQQPAYPHEDRAGHLPQAAGLCCAVPPLFVGSNADLPIVGGSILSHDRFQGGHYEFAMAKAPIEKSWTFPVLRM